MSAGQPEPFSEVQLKIMRDCWYLSASALFTMFLYDLSTLDAVEHKRMILKFEKELLDFMVSVEKRIAEAEK